jgi:N6-adenosine-specific RNA methylase IME4
MTTKTTAKKTKKTDQSKNVVARRTALLPSVPTAMAALDRLELEIASAKTLDAVKTAAHAAAGWQRMFKPVNEVADRAGEVWIEAEAKIGIELAKYPKAKGGEHGGKKRLDGYRKSPSNKSPSLKELCVTKKRAARARKLGEQPKAIRKAIIKTLKAAGKGVTPAAVLAASRQEAKAAKRHNIATAAFNAEGPFDVVVIDPPWPMQKIDRDVRPNQDAFDYPTMSIDELREFWPKEIAPRITDDCHLFCWTTQKFLLDGIAIVQHWGFKYVLEMVWHKPGGFQPIGLPQYNGEFIIYARKGSPIFIDTKDFPCVFEAPRREHSRKPTKFYETVARVTGGSRLDVFARERHPGFAQYGNEVDKFDDELPAVKSALEWKADKFQVMFKFKLAA